MTTAAIETFEIVLELGRKSWGMGDDLTTHASPISISQFTIIYRRHFWAMHNRFVPLHRELANRFFLACTTLVQICPYHKSMAFRSKTQVGRDSVRQSVTIPKTLAEEAARVARERNLTRSGALVFLAERGAKAERDAQRKLRRDYQRFMKEKDPKKKLDAGEDLIRSIFGPDAIA